MVGLVVAAHGRLAQALLTYAQRNIRFASELVRDAAARHAAS